MSLNGSWSRPTDAGEAARRAGGRRRYNTTRRLRAEVRRVQVVRFLVDQCWGYGSQRRAAAALGVSPATISRDMRLILDRLNRGGIRPAGRRPAPNGGARAHRADGRR